MKDLVVHLNRILRTGSLTGYMLSTDLGNSQCLTSMSGQGIKGLTFKITGLTFKIPLSSGETVDLGMTTQ